MSKTSKSIYYRIYYLVSTLDASEKRYIRKYLKTFKEENDTLYFFDNLCKLKIYDEVAILDIFKDIKKTNNISKQLNTNILKSLIQYNVNNSDRLKILQYLAEAQVLYEKKALDELSLTIKNGLDLFDDNDFDIHKSICKIRLIDWYHTLSITNFNYCSIEKSKQNFHTIKKHIDIIDYTAKSAYFTEGVVYMMQHALTPYDGFMSLMNDELFESTLEVVKDVENIRFVNYCICLKIIGKWDTAYATLLSKYNIILLKKKAIKLSEFPLLFVLIQLDVLLGNHKDYELHLKILESILENDDTKFNSHTLNRDYFCYIDVLNLNHCTIFNIIPENDLVINRIENILYESNKQYRFIALEALLLYHFSIKNYDKVLIYILREINSPNFSTMSKSNLYFIKWMTLFCYVEQQEYRILESKLLSIKRYIEKFRKPNEVETILLSLLQNIIIKEGEVEMEIIQDCIVVLKNNIEFVRSTFNFFDIIKWLESKR